MNKEIQKLSVSVGKRNLEDRIALLTPEDIYSPKSHYEAMFYNTYFKLAKELSDINFMTISVKIADVEAIMKNYIQEGIKNNIFEDLKKYTTKDYTKEEVYDSVGINYMNQSLINTIMRRILHITSINLK